MKMKKLIIGILALAILNGCAVGTAMRNGKEVKVYRKDVKNYKSNSLRGSTPCSDDW